MSRNYKDTLNLPSTDFPMKAGLIQREPERLQLWEEEKLSEKILKAREGKPLFVLHDGPPFANGDVHMGTGLNKILKDFIVKSKSMAGFRAPYIPGWDCHGLPIEFKVVKSSKGLTPAEVRSRSEEMARTYIDVQREQFKRLGVLGDWDHPYLTLDPAYEAVVVRSFAALVEKNLVYQKKKPVFWSTGAQTALAEAEVEYQDKESPSVYVAFDFDGGTLAGQSAMVIWTTTPWTLPANLAVALHPDLPYVRATVKGSEGTRDVVVAEGRLKPFMEACGLELQGAPERVPFAELENSKLSHPFLNRSVPVLAGDFVTLETGTGCVHMAPGHGEDDYQLGIKHGLDLLAPVDDNGCFTEEVGVSEWIGKYVFKANDDVIALLKEKKALLGVETYRHSYPHCWRSKTPVIFRAVDQFFIDVESLRAKALQAIDKVEWMPHWGRNRIYGTVESRPDWCISRQRSWGVPLPVFYNEEGVAQLKPEWIRKVADLVEEHGTNIWFELDDETLCQRLGLPQGLTRRSDTLDVWIDSGVSHEAVLRTHPELRVPADVYIEATDQHRGWFQSSLLLSVALHGEAPYRTVITHGFVVDVDGKKISKSAAYKKPTDAGHFVNRHGADVVRLWVSCLNYTDEVPFSEEMFKRLADTYRRIRNTLRILLGNLADYDPGAEADPSTFPFIDRWVLAQFQDVVETCRKAYETYEFHKVYHALNHFCAVDLSSLYIDITKDRLYCDEPGSARRRATQQVMKTLFDGLCRLLAPVLVFTADEAWRHAGNQGSVHLELFPEPDDGLRDSQLQTEVGKLLKWREAISQKLEEARRAKVMAASLEAEVDLRLPAADRATFTLAELEEFFIVSKLNVSWEETEEPQVEVRASEHPKCPRCWRRDKTVGSNPHQPELCSRCAEVMNTVASA